MSNVDGTLFDRTEIILQFVATVRKPRGKLETSEDKLNYFPRETPCMLCIFHEQGLKQARSR